MSDRDLAEREARAEEGGGRARQDRQRRLGRMTARERIAALIDENSFVEFGKHVLHRHEGESDSLDANRHPGDGLVCGLATIRNQTVALYAHDPTVLRGALGHAASQKLCRLLDVARRRGHPVIALADCDGVRVEEGTDAIDAYGEVIRRTIDLKGRVPQITLVCGLCVGAAAYNAALTDLTAMIAGQSYLFITGPKVTKVVTGEDVTLDDLGGPEMHARKTGAVHAVLADEAEGIAWVKRILDYLNNPRLDRAEDRDSKIAIPGDPRRAYDMRKVIEEIFDRDSITELTPRFGPNLLTALARLGGRSVAVVASQPLQLAGCLDVDASRKGAAFVTWAGQMKLPIVTLVDVPGYLPGRRQEEGGILPHGATLLTAYGNAHVPMLCLVLRKSFGGASVLAFASDIRLALPGSRIAPMGADATIEVVLGPENPVASEEEKKARERERAAWLERHDHAWAAAETGYVDRVIAPEHARRELNAALARLESAR
ncbi:MAG: acyl-CoA carboxylase subunit beta [Myxococcales bacterium]|nr:methylmalonyl-CoA carboxyltransferase [Myxococcales bacterium]